MFAWTPAGKARGEEPSSQEKSVELESVRSQIRDLQNDIQAAQGEADRLQKDIQSNERDAVEVKKRLSEIENEINTRAVKVAALNVDKADREKTLKGEQQLLAQQIRAAYKIGRNDYLKLLLNQEDPDLVGRMLVYYDYYNRARADRIEQINSSLREINQIKSNIQTEQEKLDGLRKEQLNKLEQFTRSRASRKESIARLQAYISGQGKQLQVLQRNEQELEMLVDQLRRQESIVKSFEEVPPFTALKGKLKWPVPGKIGARFGTSRKGGKLKWQGVLIRAGSGTDVHAVSTGKVVFADWFRNLGLLIIVDHGNGFMSLYGHNERLLKKVGDWVQAGESIAKVGDTGGQEHPSLYFEIRSSGTPVDPSLWCKS
jgi:septal ring factor EnvC (AmiA/AmiB activator)